MERRIKEVEDNLSRAFSNENTQIKLTLAKQQKENTEIKGALARLQK